MQRLLIIGCGDIARRALPWLVKHFRVYAAVRSPARIAELRALGATPLIADLDRPASLKRLAGIGSLVLHFAPPQEKGARDRRTQALLATFGYCVEPSLGADRVALAFLCNAYEEQELEGGDVRTVLHLHPALAPFKCAVLPLSKKLSDQAQVVYEKLAKKFMVDFDETGSIGKRYRREDEIGTPYCITVDFETETDGCVTVRDRDTMEQVRLPIDELTSYVEARLDF